MSIGPGTSDELVVDVSAALPFVLRRIAACTAGLRNTGTEAKCREARSTRQRRLRP